MAMFRSLVASAQQRQPPAGPAGGDSGLEAQYTCPICLEVYHRPVAIGSCGHTFCGECLQPCLQVPSPLCPLCRLPFDPKKVDKATHVEKQLSSYKAPCRGCNKKPSPASRYRGRRWGLQGHKGRGHSQGHLRAEHPPAARRARAGLMGTATPTSEQRDPGKDESAHFVLPEGPGADGQLPQVRPRGAHITAYPQQHPQQVHLRLPVLWCPQPGPAGAGEALCGKPPQRPQPRGVPHLLGNALGGPQLQERQLPAAPASPTQVLLRHLCGLQY
ncbi:E3 ubiquitin-protein ligase RNF166 isoform X3 [Homo sapiens]|uniref:E3 ubiquitin-protein ligase RNF166 isoform X3 n=1 Tax=Homo sapiens TaxID=9606 RepID=UPI000387C6A0|nr:E3 ubiquitin-protein ligase RNF166 isoform X3 [Homo sapiens]XP_054235494.1 E3 ubiquitin-protein ligase RNF166 isoform X3 [Homo sapiens]